MTEKSCVIYLDQAITSLHKMRVAVNDLPPDGTVNFLIAAREVTELLGKAVAIGMWTINETKHD